MALHCIVEKQIPVSNKHLQSKSLQSSIIGFVPQWCILSKFKICLCVCPVQGWSLKGSLKDKLRESLRERWKKERAMPCMGLLNWTFRNKGFGIGTLDLRIGLVNIFYFLINEILVTVQENSTIKTLPCAAPNWRATRTKIVLRWIFILNVDEQTIAFAKPFYTHMEIQHPLKTNAHWFLL